MTQRPLVPPLELEVLDEVLESLGVVPEVLSGHGGDVPGAAGVAVSLGMLLEELSGGGIVGSVVDSADGE